MNFNSVSFSPFSGGGEGFIQSPNFSALMMTSWAKHPDRSDFIRKHSEIFRHFDGKALGKITDKPWLSALVFVLEFPAQLDRAAWDKQYAALSLQDTHCLLSYIFDQPEKLQGLDLGKVEQLLIKPWGGSIHDLHKFNADLMAKEGRVEKNLNPVFNEGTAKKIQRIYEQETRWSDLKEAPVDFTSGKVLRVLGRTVLFKSEENSLEVLAFKFRRKKETLSEFCREKEITDLFRQHVGFKSRLPKPVSLTIPENLPTDLLPENVETSEPALYIQKVEEEYYCYLQQIQDDGVWKEARDKFLFDSGLQLSLGQLPPFAELFHNEKNFRNYQPLANLIPSINKGSGRLETPFNKTRYPNAGAWGVRDVGDGPHLFKAAQNPMLESADLFRLRNGTVHYLLMNGLAKLMLVDSLLLIHRLALQDRLDWENPDTIETVADWLKKGQIEALCGFTGKSQAVCTEFVDQLPVNWSRQAKQIIFWAQTNERGYPKYLDKGELPEGLYERGMPFELNLAEAENYVKGMGFQQGEHADFGCYNGPLGWIESEKSWYWTSAFAVAVHFAQKPQTIYKEHEEGNPSKRKRTRSKISRKLSFK